VREAARRALQEYRDATIEGARIETSWGPERDLTREQGPLLGNSYRARVRYRLLFTEVPGGTIVGVLATVERRAPGGPRSIRWERVESDGRWEREFLDSLWTHLFPEKKS